jgi:hypothetical protein
VTRFISSFLLVLGTAAGCGDPNDGQTGISGNSLKEQSSYSLSCTIDTLVLEIPIELFYELDRPYTEGGSATLTFSAAVTFEEQTATALIEAGVSKDRRHLGRHRDHGSRRDSFDGGDLLGCGSIQ